MGDDHYTRWRRAQEQRRAPAVREAQRLIEQDDFDAAERAVLSVDDSIYGAVAIAALYRARLSALATGGGAAEKARRVALFRRAWLWARGCYPDPHTADEAEAFAASRARAHAELVDALGFDPGEE